MRHCDSVIGEQLRRKSKIDREMLRVKEQGNDHCPGADSHHIVKTIFTMRSDHLSFLEASGSNSNPLRDLEKR